MYININQLSVVLECHRNTAAKRYPVYLEKVGKEPWQQLTLDDVSRVEKRRLKDLRDMLF